jgi:hypothetical protein
MIAGQGAGNGIADIDTPSRAAQIALFMPAAITIHLISGIKATLFDEAFGKAKRHRSVIGPFARSEMERTAADHVGSGANVPGGLNSKVVPKASPAANPSRAPRYLSRVILEMQLRPMKRPFLDPSHLLGGFR